MEIPKKISPCPITEAIVEMRFKSKVPEEAIFGVLYSEFKSDFPEVEKLPILQIPEHFRSNDPNLIHKPWYKLKNNDKYIIQIGPRMFSLINVGEYVGWIDFSSKIKDVFGRLINTLAIENFVRIGLRYINVFQDKNIFKDSNLNIELNGKSLTDNEINIITVLPYEYCMQKLIIINPANVEAEGIIKNGSVIDIDTFLKECPIECGKSIDLLMECINNAHEEEKQLFFSLLSMEMIKSLNPKY
jgi:uncharacterized protein (TIGR04255 family)